MAGRESRPKRWQKALDKLAERSSELTSALEAFNAAASDLAEIQSEYEEWRDNMPDSLQSSPTYEKLDEICNLDLTEQSVDEITDIVEAAMNVELPRGFGRD